MSFASSTITSRLRAASSQKKQTNGVFSRNGDFVLTNGTGTGLVKKQGDLSQLLKRLDEAEREGPDHMSPQEWDSLIDQLRRAVRYRHHDFEGAAPSPTQDHPQPVSTGKPLLVTALGARIINSSDEPVASVANPPIIPNARVVSASPDPKATVIASAIISTDSTAPQFKPQATVWKQVVQSGRNDAPVNVNGQELKNPSLVTVASTGTVVKVPLSKAVGATSAQLPISSDIKPAAIQPLDKIGVVQALAVTPAPNTTVSIPASLLQQNVGIAGHADATIPAGFVLSGDVKLFGGKIDAELYSFHGAAGDDTKAFLAVVSQSPVLLNDLLPSPGFTFGTISVQHPTISVYSKTGPGGKDIGLWLEAGLALDGPLVEAGIVLKDVFAANVPSIDVSAHIGGYQGLGDAFQAPHDLNFSAALAGMDVNIGRFLELTSAKIDISGVKGTAGYSWTIGLSGDALITVPGSVAPLNAHYEISKAQTVYTIVLKITNPQWKDAMGIPGFHLDQTAMTAKFSQANKDAPFTFDITASLALGATVVHVAGHYGKDAWDFHASAGDFSLQNLETTFNKLFKADLLPCEHDVVFKGLSLDITSNDKTLSFHGGVEIDSYAAATASLELTPTGVHVTASLNSAKFDIITIDKAQMDLVISKAGTVNPDPKTPGTTAAFTILGELSVKSVTLNAEVSFAKSGNGFVWVVYAKATTDLPLSKFVKVPQDLDFGLRSVVAMASNTNDGSLFPIHAFDYAVKEGFQLLAKFDCPPELAKALHMPAPGPSVTLELDLSAATTQVDIVFAADQALTLSPHMISPSVKAGIVFAPAPSLFVEGDMKVQLSGNPGPSDFAVRLLVGPTEAKAEAFLQSNWVNPFHISPEVTVLAPVGLGIVIDYAAVTYPSGLEFTGGLRIGETSARVAFEIGQNPEDGVLIANVQNLSLRDLVQFTSLVIQHELPLPAQSVLDFKDLYLGISTGGSINNVFYPPGCTFNADVVLLGKELKIHIEVDEKLPGLKASAEIDPFNLGPLIVSGNTKKSPEFDLEFGTKLQQLSIDGKIELFDSDIGVTVDVTMVPPAITFDAELKFSDLLTFKIDAHAAGQIQSIKDVVKSDFSLYADFEQSLLDHMVSLANTYIAVAKKGADEGLESAKAELTEAQAAFDNKVAAAKRDVQVAQVAWNKKNDDINAAATAQINSLKAQLAVKQAAVDQAEKNFNAKLDQLNRNLQQEKDMGARNIQDAQTKLNQAIQDANNAINGAKQQLDGAERDMTNRFGNAENSIRDAQNKVDSAQSFCNDRQRDVDNCEDKIKHGSFGERIKAAAQIVGYEAALRGAQAGLAVAKGVLAAAQAVVSGPGYFAAKTAISAAQSSLDAANAAADASISSAKGSLSAAQAAEQGSITVAQKALDAAKTGSEELHVWNAAKDALAAFTTVATTGISAANATVQALSNCAERLAFDAANAALNAALSATKELDAAKSVLSAVEHSIDEFTSFGTWLVKHAGNIFDVKKVELSGSLNDAANKRPFIAHVVGTFADANVDVHVEFTPGQAEAFVKGLVMKFVDEAKTDIGKFIHNL
ncbi:hypothetical protein CERZMDRAFT_107904 [Cercospora zeae-maydis SCOH1-5]|uniref:Uncharacterized protein n=1 Tax=Cercospora zeae-maydis SCOH1-5 TaxID=717836 RepID=A0A6A6EXW3_9PEZI|nr:hypothetical protein CERZMDRAFT_107904 [Cercospora zeae-maydis SCOH1-5]